MYDSKVEDYAAWAKKAGFKMATSDGRLIGPLVGPSSLYWAPGAEGRMAYVTTDGGLLAPGTDGIVHPPALLRFTIEEGTYPRSSTDRKRRGLAHNIQRQVHPPVLDQHLRP